MEKYVSLAENKHKTKISRHAHVASILDGNGNLAFTRD